MKLHQVKTNNVSSWGRRRGTMTGTYFLVFANSGITNNKSSDNPQLSWYCTNIFAMLYLQRVDTAFKHYLKEYHQFSGLAYKV